MTQKNDHVRLSIVLFLVFVGELGQHLELPLQIFGTIVSKGNLSLVGRILCISQMHAHVQTVVHILIAQYHVGWETGHDGQICIIPRITKKRGWAVMQCRYMVFKGVKGTEIPGQEPGASGAKPWYVQCGILCNKFLVGRLDGLVLSRIMCKPDIVLAGKSIFDCVIASLFRISISWSGVQLPECALLSASLQGHLHVCFPPITIDIVVAHSLVLASQNMQPIVIDALFIHREHFFFVLSHGNVCRLFCEAWL
jgi:hypothetical protein